MVIFWPCATVLSFVLPATFGMVNAMPDELTVAPGAPPALVTAVSEKLAPPPSKLPGLVLLSAVMPMLLNDAARFGYVVLTLLPGRPICTLPPSVRYVVAAVPVTCAKAIEVVGFDTCSTRYDVPAVIDRLNVAAVVGETTTAPD